MTWQSIRKVLVGAAIAALGAVLTYGTHYVTGTDFGSWTPVIMAAWSVAANLIRKVVTDNGGTVAAVAGFVALMSLLTAPARADDPPPPAVYVPPPLVETVQRHDAEIRSLRDAAATQADVNAAVLAELKAMRADIAAMKEKPAGAKDKPATLPPVAAKPVAAAWGPDCPECNTPGMGCGCPGKYGRCYCEEQAKARAAAAAAAATPAASAVRAPVGHTHTCPRCGTTWDHLANPGHNCPRCGTAQYVQDTRPRMVYGPVGYVTPAAPPLTLPSMGGCANGACASGGCANGSCSSGRAVQTVRGGFFRR